MPVPERRIREKLIFDSRRQAIRWSLQLSFGRLVGYARVSTDDQDLSLQMDSLIGLGVSHDDIFTDKVSGAKTERPGLALALRSCSKATRSSFGGSTDLDARCTTWSS